MKLRHIEVFRAVMLTGTVSGAAKLLSVSQPAVTKVLLHAEDQLGFKLFMRNKGRIIPTAEATVLFAEAEKIFVGLDTIRTIARNLRQSGSGLIRLAVPPALCLDLIPSVVTAFRKELPEITVSVHSHHYAEAISAVLRQQVDMAIAFNPEEHPALAVEHFATAQFVGCFPARMRQLLPPVIELAELQRFPFIALSIRDPLGSGIKAAIDLSGINLPATVEVNTNSLALALVERGAGAAIVDEYTAAHFGANVAIRPLAPALTFEVGLVTLGNAATSNALKRLRQLLYRMHDATQRIDEDEKV